MNARPISGLVNIDRAKPLLSSPQTGRHRSSRETSSVYAVRSSIRIRIDYAGRTRSRSTSRSRTARRRRASRSRRTNRRLRIKARPNSIQARPRQNTSAHDTAREALLCLAWGRVAAWDHLLLAIGLVRVLGQGDGVIWFELVGRVGTE